MDISANSLSLVSTLVVVVVTAFACSALLRNFKSLILRKNYLISGIIGVVIGILYFIWASKNLEDMVLWLKKYGVDLLLLVILACALVLYFFKGRRSHSPQK
jgi:peptidoglycan/LPS O-acetylase OafA/YrhL